MAQDTLGKHDAGARPWPYEGRFTGKTRRCDLERGWEMGMSPSRCQGRGQFVVGALCSLWICTSFSPEAPGMVVLPLWMGCVLYNPHTAFELEGLEVTRLFGFPSCKCWLPGKPLKARNNFPGDKVGAPQTRPGHLSTEGQGIPILPWRWGAELTSTEVICPLVT